MNKSSIVITSLLISSLILTPATVLAQTASPSAGARQEERIANLKQRADNEITQRINSLNNLLTKLNNAQKLSSADKTQFASQIQNYINSLTSLKAKIDADTDLVTLRADAKSIFTNFRVYAVFMPKLAELIAVDRMGVTVDNLNTISGKLQALISQAQSAGKDVSSLQSSLSDLNAKIADAKTQYQAVEAEISPLTPDGYPGNLATLKDGRSKLQAGNADLKTARNDAIQIRNGLKSLGIKPTATASATTK